MYDIIQGVSFFAIYLISSLVLLGAFTAIYLKLTPYSEIAEIRKGKIAPAISLGGAMMGFTMPLLAMSFYGVSWFDFCVWSIFACAVQAALFLGLNRVLPMELEQDNKAISLIYFFSSICVGALNAFSLIPH